MKKVCRILRFSGRVQGVGFRQTALYLARDLPLAGTVCNLDDGSVELVAEGQQAHIDSLVRRLQDRFGGFITGVRQSDAPPRGLPQGIRIVH